MIALCLEHHSKADVNTYTKEQLRDFKQNGIAHSKEVRGRFDWLRNDLHAVVGSLYCTNTLDIFTFNRKRVIWFNRDKENYFLLNVQIVSPSGEEMLLIEDNDWIVKGNPIDIESPPSGKLLNIKYCNDEYLRIEYKEVPSNQGGGSPLTVVEVRYKVGNLDFGPGYITAPGITITNVCLDRCDSGLFLWEQNGRWSIGIG
ncbi:MAG: hypothetical protein DRP79_02175 [Planctomycetota bacterium]|nr:MAG: hypothetical protein DRP79_02175 [Planctomycetota bacterium]